MSEIEDSKMPLIDHLIELRKRLLWSLLAFVIAFGISLYFSRNIWEFLIQPLQDAGQNELYFNDFFEAFFVQIKVAFFAALMIGFPVFATQIYRFVAPGLYRNEKMAFLPFLAATPVLFTMGAALAFYVVTPLAVVYLLGFAGDIGGVSLKALPAIGKYLNFVTSFMFGFGVAFQLPLLLILLEKAGVVTRAQLISGRRYAIVGIFAISAFLTPPDVTSQLLLAIPLCLLYELALIVIWFTQRRKTKTDLVTVSE